MVGGWTPVTFKVVGNYGGSKLPPLSFLEMFPDRVAALVLDGIVDHTVDVRTNLMRTATAFERAFNGWVRWCELSSKSCPWQALEAAGIVNRFTQLLQRANTRPLVANGCLTYPLCDPVITGRDMNILTQSFISGGWRSERWELLAYLLDQAYQLDQGDREFAIPWANSNHDPVFAI